MGSGNTPKVLLSRSFSAEKGLLGMRNRRGPEAAGLYDLREDIDNAFARLESEVDAIGYQGALPNNPAGPSSEGDLYYNTTISKLMFYDATRAKWLSVETIELPFGRKLATASGSYYRAVDGVTFTSTIGYVSDYAGTVVGISWSKSAITASDFEVMADGVAIGSTSSAAASGKDKAIDADFAVDQILGVLNKAGSDVTEQTLGKLFIKWRA